jgi:3,4-dihydroxy-2-butanone 4-phosphate synthase
MTPARLAFMLRHTSGVVCVALTRARCQSLAIPLMVPEHNNEPQRTQFTVSVDAATGTTTGISAAERAHTIRSLADAKLGPKAFLRPGHVFPLRARHFCRDVPRPGQPGQDRNRVGQREPPVAHAVSGGADRAGALQGCGSGPAHRRYRGRGLRPGARALAQPALGVRRASAAHGRERSDPATSIAW